MNSNDTSVFTPSRPDLDRCDCRQCNGRGGTARVCFNARKLAARKSNCSAARKAALLLLGGVLLQGQSIACVTTTGGEPHAAVHPGRAAAVPSTADPDYYRSIDNPFFED